MPLRPRAQDDVPRNISCLETPPKAARRMQSPRSVDARCRCRSRMRRGLISVSLTWWRASFSSVSITRRVNCGRNLGLGSSAMFLRYVIKMSRESTRLANYTNTRLIELEKKLVHRLIFSVTIQMPEHTT